MARRGRQSGEKKTGVAEEEEVNLARIYELALS